MYQGSAINISFFLLLSALESAIKLWKVKDKQLRTVKSISPLLLSTLLIISSSTTIGSNRLQRNALGVNDGLKNPYAAAYDPITGIGRLRNTGEGRWSYVVGYSYIKANSLAKNDSAQSGINYGITENISLDINLPSYQRNFNTGQPNSTGFGDFGFNLLYTTSLGTENTFVGVLGGLTFPSGRYTRANQIGSGYYHIQPEVVLEHNYSFYGSDCREWLGEVSLAFAFDFPVAQQRALRGQPEPNTVTRSVLLNVSMTDRKYQYGINVNLNKNRNILVTIEPSFNVIAFNEQVNIGVGVPVGFLPRSAEDYGVRVFLNYQPKYS